MRNLSFVRFGLSAAVLALCCVTGAARQATPDEGDKTADARLRPAALQFTDWSAPVNLGPPVSTAATELTPFLARNGRDLFFASNREAGSGPTDLYVSRREGRGGEWGEPVPLGPAINTPDYGEFGPALTRDGRHLLFVSDRPGGCGASDIYVARRLSRDGYTEWSEPQNLGCEVNSTGIELSPSLFEDAREDDDGGDDGRAGRTVHLYFSSGLRPGGLGFGDIYVSQLQADGTFGPASPVVEFNTPFNEIRPNIRRRDGLEIFFDSNRPGSLGGSPDLYVSTRECTTCPWAAPVNLGPAVNSAAIDGGASLSSDGTELYFMSNRPGGFGGQDIYVIERRRLTGGEPD